MNDEIKQVIKQSPFKVEEGRYVYVKTSTAPSIEDHFMVTKDGTEITVVTREENLDKLEVIEKNKDFYKVICLNVSVPFYSVGFLATVSSAIAKAGMNILIISTYSKDYIMVKCGREEDARKVLLDLGFQES